MIEEEQFKRVQECLKRSQDIWNQRHPTGSVQGTSMYTGRLICSSCGGVYSIYKQSSRGDNRNVRYWKCRHYDPVTKEPCKMPILTEKQLDGMFLQALMRMKTEPTLYHEETKQILTGIIKERQRMESDIYGLSMEFLFLMFFKNIHRTFVEVSTKCLCSVLQVFQRI